MMVELAAKLGLSHDSSTPYYPQANGQVEAINKVLKRMLQRMIGVHKRSWHQIQYSALWAYRTSVRNATGFTPFQLVYDLEAILPVQCEISSLKLAIDLLPGTSEEEACFLELSNLMKPIVMPLWLTKPIRNESRHSSTRMSNLVSSQKVTWSFFTTKNLINWEQVNSSLYEWAPILLNVY